MSDEPIKYLRDLHRRAASVNRALQSLELITSDTQLPTELPAKLIDVDNNDIYNALALLSQGLANSYAQVKTDLNDTSRVSWAGTSHEIREILRSVLEILAPDTEVKAQSWYKPEKDAKGPTQKQKALYILRKRNAGSKIQEVAAQVDTLEEMVAKLVRSLYSRASDAAHGMKDRGESRRILNYFEAFIYDLLDLS